MHQRSLRQTAGSEPSSSKCRDVLDGVSALVCHKIERRKLMTKTIIFLTEDGQELEAGFQNHLAEKILGKEKGKFKARMYCGPYVQKPETVYKRLKFGTIVALVKNEQNEDYTMRVLSGKGKKIFKKKLKEMIMEYRGQAKDVWIAALMVE